MNKYVILTDSCVDLSNDYAKELEIGVVPVTFSIKGKEYLNYLDEREMRTKDFYDLLRNNVVPKTTQVNPNRFLEFFEEYLKQGLDILYISFSSALSGTYQSSTIAADELRGKYPERTIVTLNSLCASMGQGLLVSYAANLKKAGKDILEVAEWVEDNKMRISHLFTVGDLNYLRRGGRLSYAKAIIGTILKIKPLLHVNSEGKLVQTGATRGRRSALDRLVDRLVETIENPEEQSIFISHGDCIEDVEYVIEQIKSKITVKDFVVNYIGPVIGSHSGIGTVAIFYLGNDRTIL